MIPYPLVLVHVGPILYWALVMILAMGSLCAAAFALRFPRRGLVYVSAGALAGAVALVAVPTPGSFATVHVLLGFVALALSVVGGSPAVLLTLSIATRGSMREGPRGGLVVAEDPAHDRSEESEVLRGGMTIGIFERFATTAAIMAGFLPAVAIVVAIKSVGRFTELNEAAARERFIIGTLVSLVWAGACAALFVLS